MNRKSFNHFTWDDRLKLEALLKLGIKPMAIADELNFHHSSVYREIKKGLHSQLQSDLTFKTVYAAEVAERKYLENLSAKGADLKIGSDIEFANTVEKIIIEKKYSPYAALEEIKRKNLSSLSICVTTLYNYINKGIFRMLSNEDLPAKPKRKRPYNSIRRARAPKGDSIEKRPEEVNTRIAFGHWEMDTVKGKRDTAKVLLVLTERVSRKEITLKISQCSVKCVIKALNTLERRYGKMFAQIFKTITVDNGSEFANCDDMMKSCLFSGNRTKIYYCHPFSSWERGSNEVQNKLIRRWIPKGTPIENYTRDEIRKIEEWINNYPRKLFGGKTANEQFEHHLSLL